ncbi:MAG: CAP domain-containing protein [Anaerolineales bacterium]|jgi:uncharacterized protein YkwD
MVKARKAYHLSLFLLLAASLAFPLFGISYQRAQAQASGYDVIAAVNQLRAANGLAPYQVSAALMSAAQAHSEYMASTGAISHSGAGGSRPIDRVTAAGYGGGAQVFVSENIAAGMGWTAQDAVQAWQGDSLHLDTMLSPNYGDAGAGVAVAGNTIYFTLDVAGGGGGTSSGSGSSQGAADVTIYPQFTPVDTATPQPDGSIIHTVQDGQAFWNIAAIYGITIDELLDMNNLTENTFIFPGDKLVVKLPNDTPTPTKEATVTPYPATATNTPSSTPTPLSELEISATGTAQAELLASLTPAPSTFSKILLSGRQMLMMLIGLLVIGGLVLVIAGSVMNLRK